MNSITYSPNDHLNPMNTITESFIGRNSVYNSARFIRYLCTQEDPISGATTVVHYMNINLFTCKRKLILKLSSFSQNINSTYYAV